jgi:hypothetical protein
LVGLCSADDEVPSEVSHCYFYQLFGNLFILYHLKNKIGRRVIVEELGRGTLMYFGIPVFAFDSGAYVGVALDEPLGKIVHMIHF